MKGLRNAVSSFYSKSEWPITAILVGIKMNNRSQKKEEKENDINGQKSQKFA